MSSYFFDYLHVQAPKGLLFLSNKFIAGQSSCCLLLFYIGLHITQLISNTTSLMMVECRTGFACHRATLDKQWENVCVAEVGYSSNYIYNTVIDSAETSSVNHAITRVGTEPIAAMSKSNMSKGTYHHGRRDGGCSNYAPARLNFYLLLTRKQLNIA